MELLSYQLEIVASVVVILSGVVAALIFDYLVNHNSVVRQQTRDDYRGR